jgi:hypothetical protein
MEIKKNNSYFEIIIDEEKFIFEGEKENPELPLILSDFSLNLNKDKIFNSPGEYNVGEIYFWGFANKNSIVYLFKSKEGNLLYSIEDLKEEIKKKIKFLVKNIDVLFLFNFFSPDLINEFKPKVVVTNKNVSLDKYKKEKTDKVKINLKKVDNLLFVFN